MLTVEAEHRRHAIIEQVHADLKNGPPAHLPSGSFVSNSAWLVLAAVAFNLTRNTFTQSYNAPGLDASLLMIPRVGFLPPTDPRVLGTINAIQTGLTEDGLVRRYNTTHSDDGLTGGEGLFLACSFWLVDALHLAGRRPEATQLFERLLRLRNDVGLLSEEWDPTSGRQVGNTPQAFSTSPSSPPRCNCTPAKPIAAITR